MEDKSMKNIIMINGTMGVGKTTVCRELQKIIPKNVFLDGDWCWDMNPFIVTEETKTMVVNNISYLLNSFLNCSEYDNIIFCWVMDEQSILDEVLSRLNTSGCKVFTFSLVCSPKKLQEHLLKDIEAGIRKEDIINKSLLRISKYDKLTTEKIDMSEITPKEAAELIKGKV